MSVVVVGSINQDYFFRSDRLPEAGETRLGEYFSCPGGKGLNQALCAHRLGMDACLISSLGSDPLADYLRAQVEAEGLPALFESQADTASGSAAIWLDETGENRIIVAPGANRHLSPDFLLDHRVSIESASVLLMQMEINMEAISCAAELAKEHDTCCILNPAPFEAQMPPGLLENVHILTPNETEFSRLCRYKNLSDGRLSASMMEDEALHRLCRNLFDGTVVITLGEAGGFVSHGDELYGDTESYYRFPACLAKAIDTAGAGDAFSAALAVSLAEKKTMRHAVAFAATVAAISVEKTGTSTSYPTRNEVEERADALYKC